MKNKFPDHIMRQLRQRFDIDENDESKDNIINSYSANHAFSELCNWNGLLGGWDTRIKGWISDVYEVELDEL